MSNGSFIGIYLYVNAVLNQIEKNDVDSNLESGVVFDRNCSENMLVNNNITNNGLLISYTNWNSGIVLIIDCNENQIFSNYVSNNQRGILQGTDSDNNLIYHNSFVQNKIEVYDHDSSCSNIWDDGYPAGGNYWSDYGGTDLYHGPYQNVTGSDGIGDTSYVIDANNADNYPLMKPYASPIGDVNNDGKVDMKDIGIAAASFGSYDPNWLRSSSPTSPRWNPDADINGDHKVDLKDIALIAANFGQHYP